ncbi:glutathione peroxidase [Marinobacterium litorale]|uniref:glutathione peroxidase n=1 Tax=Marinobacterium litorale TaxID=404770 RepID=UPI000426EED0|nr:glutathione peroxidase [Marinobacterium litorale]
MSTKGWFAAWALSCLGVSANAACMDWMDLDLRRLAGEERVNLCQAYSGKVLLIVNTASRCAFTDQYEGLEKLYGRYRDQGLVVLGFPSNDFGGQEPGDETGIQNFCRTTYGVQFPMFAKAHVRGDDADPLWQRLIQQTGEAPRWNFYKYLVGRDGSVRRVYSSMTSPQSGRLIEAVEAALAEPEE